MSAAIRVIQIVGSQVGGVRLHVHDLLLGLDPARVAQAYVYSTRLFDARFTDEVPRIEARCSEMLALDIRRPPAFGDVRNILRVIALARRCRAQILHGHGAKGGLYARLAAHVVGARAVYTPHGGSAHDAFGPVQDFVYRKTERALIPFTHLFLFESMYSADAFARRTGVARLPMLINPNGHALADEAPVRLPKHVRARPVVGFFGMLRDEKGPDLAIEVAARVPEIELHIYGDGQARAALEAQAAPLGNRVVFHGDVRDATDRMRTCDVILIPSRFESFGYVALEAALLGLPVAAFSTGGLPEILHDHPAACMAPTGDVAALAACLRAVLQRSPVESSPVLRAKFARGRMLATVSSAYSELLTTAL
ncbi:glycosyltransferase family 4 protein [Roseiterribacter gracilis]|uniref:Glycosyl transferase n=1 Tax=Roseiterribacter gracilis TaxID=2812848 RepID=A0A8S8X9S2_9PROT|nr:glycosyl transferase [Rhodospirillales bacterium TMPK1]